MDLDSILREDESSFLKVIRSGKRKESLEAIRGLLAQRLYDAEARESASVAKQLIAVINELDSVGVGREGSFVDELRAEGKANP